MKKNRVLVMSCILSLILLFSGNVLAYQDNQTVDATKKWTISFTRTVGYDDVTKSGIVVTDSNGNKVNTTLELGSNNKSIIVDPPTNGYTAGKSYTLTVKKQAHSSTGIQMNQDRILHFNIKNDNTTNDRGDNININYKIDIEKYGFYGLKQIIVTLDSNIDSTKYDVFIYNTKAEYKNNYFQGIMFLNDTDNVSTIRQHITIKTKESEIPVIPTISKIGNIDVNIKQNDVYILPTTVQAIMSDGTTKNVDVAWDKDSIDTSKTGLYIFYGTVKGYNDTDINNPIVLSVTVS